MKRVFVTAIGGDVGYGVVKAMKNSHHDLYIIGCDTQRYNYGYDLVDEFYVAPSYNDEKVWMDFVSRIIEEHKVDIFWPVTETEIKLVDKNKEAFKNIKAIVNNTNILDVAFDKGNTARTLSDIGVSIPTTWYSVDEAPREYPLIVKEKTGCGSHGVKLVNGDDDLVATFNMMTDPIIQEVIGNKEEEYTMTVFSDGNVTNNIVFKRELGLGSMSRFVELIQNNQCDEMAKIIADSFKLRGSINIQMRKKNDKFYVFEINPRISSTIGFRQKLGFNDVEWWIDLAVNKKVEQFKCKVKKAIGVRGVEEKIFIE